MQLTPSGAFEHVKESLVEYLETAYKIAHPAVFAERGELLRRRGTVAQAPFIEATPAFPTARKLIELERESPQFLPAGLAELVQHGVPVDRFALYTHQEEALLAAFSNRPDLLVATGTGSGKTEAFLLPILADVLREALTWPATAGAPQRGRYDARTNVWLHGRRHELRPAALRAIILYPMNALVNDQLARLRRILARDTSPDWQRRNLGGNVLHFGMYTSLTRPTGSWSSQSRRNRYDIYLKKLEEDWQQLREELRDTGGWPRPDSPEMLCRWDMQAAPPDVLVTNYSMLEYMLVRPIESPIFERTRQWLQATPEARLTLVLDEAHTYTGAKGTEVAHLVRRLKERLGLDAGAPKFRAIATTASLPNASSAQQELRTFAADLFGEPADRFSLIRAAPPHAVLPPRQPSPAALEAFARFQEHFDIQNPTPAVEQLAQELDLGLVDHTVEPQVALYSLLETNDDVTWVRQRTARNATLIDQLARECWLAIGSAEEQERATAGVLAAGSFARPATSTDVPPLLSMRVHAFFRGIAGLWACMDPNCPEVPAQLRTGERPRPVGKLYTDPRPWCGPACGARVLELFSCRHCGLLFLGGIPDTIHGSLWPWSDDLSGEREEVSQFRIFGVEPAYPAAQRDHRSIRSTLPTHPNEAYARAVYELEPAEEGEASASPFPNKCPRCQNYRAPGPTGRQVIEPLRTRGPRSFSIVVEDGFRVQPRAAHGAAPNYGRKALLFSDSRQEAATLAADLREDHSKDLIRQLLYRALWACRTCTGAGTVEQQPPFRIGQPQEANAIPCPDCQGTGRAMAATPLSFDELRGRVIGVELGAGINPTNGVVRDFFARLDAGTPSCSADADLAFALALRRELAEDEFALEPLGLASWRVQLPEAFGMFAPLSEAETQLLVRSVARLLATENVLLPARPQQPWDWPTDLVKSYERNTLVPGPRRQGTSIPYNLGTHRKLGRYVIAVSQALVRRGRLANPAAAEQWVRDLHWPLWNALRQLGVLEPAGATINGQVPQGIRIDAFVLHPIGAMVHRCRACAYVMSEALLDVCLRCGQATEPIPAQTLRNFYRRAAAHALPGSGFDDPYPLRAIEHSAQIPGAEARDIERWFQDLFHDHQQPLDHRVDVLSVTTTMEMGIDIGSLLCVGLRNVPPTVANYQQRAGRAGRRGSAIATVLTFAQARSHDQYYFQRPPEIVSTPPRVPALYLNNDVIARRHVRSLVLQGFFAGLLQGRQPSALFSSWGTVADFANRQAAAKLRHYLAANRAPLIARCASIVDPVFADQLGRWQQELVDEVQEVITRHDAGDDLFAALITAGLLPKYAFPVDVVSLAIPSTRPSYGADDEAADTDAMQRDLKIALAEYAPGAEVIRGSFPNTFLYRSAGLYDPYQPAPDYRPTGILLECQDCHSVALLPVGAAPPDQCPECRSLNVSLLPYLRPAGFTVDAAQPQGGGVRYEGGGRERGGYAGPARLLVGQTAFNTGRPQTPFAPQLYAYVRQGDLFVCNKGANRDFPGFLICATCGRALDETEPGPHTYPAHLPPHRGRQLGPRAGQPCPNRTDFQNQVILGHTFASEVILLGVELPATMDAPFGEPAGKAVWYSFGTLVANAAALVLQVDPGELQVGVRAVRQSPNRVLGEVFLYDDVPGGAGYARAIEQHLQAILEKARALAHTCGNPDCSGACYHCMYDYRNQRLHPLLDRHLGAAVLDYLLCGTRPSLDPQRTAQAAAALGAFARFDWTMKPAMTLGTQHFSCVLEDALGQQTGLWVIHPLEARPGPGERMAILAQYGVRPAVHTAFDLERRPFWVLNNLTRP